MSEPAPPNVAVAFGSVSPPQGDIAALNVHLGGTKEVSSFMVKLHNLDGKYSSTGAYALAEGMSGYICVGRSPFCPLLITCKIEDLDEETTPTEDYLTISGRCWGEKLFRHTVTKNYLAQKGEAIVKDIVDYYAGLVHVRGGVELVENTDTTYSDLKPEDEPAWDILKYVAETADKTGAIGFDFRIEPDGKFAFFPKNSKVHNILKINEPGNENVDLKTRYRKSIKRIRNKITIYGLADKSYPIDKVSWTRSLIPADGAWTGSIGTVSLDSYGAPDGGACIRLSVSNNYAGVVDLNFTAGHEPNFNLYPALDLQLKLAEAFSGTGFILLMDTSGKFARKTISVSPDAAWHVIEAGGGAPYAVQWEHVDSGFNWAAVSKIRVSMGFPGVGSGDFRVHQLFVGGRRFSATREDTASQAAYTDGEPREYVETDEELWTDNECDLRAKALLAFLKDPDVFLTVKSTLFVYNDTPVLPGDKLKVWLPRRGIADTYFRVDSADYDIAESNTTTLEMTLELEKVHPQIADYIYGLRTFTVNVEKLSRTKSGRRGVPIISAGGLGSPSRFTTNIDIDKASPALNLFISSIHKAAFGHDGTNTFLAAMAGDLILESAVNHLIRPNSDGSDKLGNGSFRWDEVHVKNKIFVAGWEVINTEGRINMSSMPRDTSGYVLEAQGAGSYPMYVDPNGRYAPALHNHANMYPAGGSDTGSCGDTSNYWHVVAGDSVWYNALGHMDMIDDLAAIMKLKRSERTDKKGVPLIDVTSLPETVRSKEGMIHAGHLMGLALGAIKQLNTKVEVLKKELEQLQNPK